VLEWRLVVIGRLVNYLVAGRILYFDLILEAKNKLPVYLPACACHNFLPHYALVTYHQSADVLPRYRALVPDTPRPMRWQHRPRFDPFDPISTHFEPLRQIPQEKVDKHTAGTHRRAAVRAQSRSNTLHGDDRRGAYGHLLARAV
jgi:hypothetical protein